MKTKLILLTVFVITLSLNAFAQDDRQMMSKMTSNRMDRAETEKILMQNERLAWKNLVERKYEEFGRMLASDYRGVYPEHTTTKETELAEVRKLNFKSADVSDARVQFIDDHSAVVTAMVKTVVVMPDGKTANLHLRTTSIIAMRGGEWLCVYHASMEIPMKEMKN